MLWAAHLPISVASLTSERPSDTVVIAIVATAGSALLLAGLAALMWPEAIAHANDTRGPRWIRDFSLHGPDPARPGRTSPNLLRWIGALLLLMGLVLLVGIALDAPDIS